MTPRIFRQPLAAKALRSRQRPAKTPPRTPSHSFSFACSFSFRSPASAESVLHSAFRIQNLLLLDGARVFRNGGSPFVRTQVPRVPREQPVMPIQIHGRILEFPINSLVWLLQNFS